MASAATGTFPFTSTTIHQPSGGACALTHTRAPKNLNHTLADTVVTAVTDRGALTYLLMIFRSRLKSIFAAAPRRRPALLGSSEALPAAALSGGIHSSAPPPRL